MQIKRKRVAAVATAVAVLGLAAVAYAAWMAGGSGSGTAKAGQAVALTTSDASASTDASLYPGATGDLRITINNPNPFPVRVTAIAAGDGAVTSAGGSDDEDCDASTGVSLVPQSGLAIDVAAEDSVTTSVSGAVSMDNSSADACQGATFSIPVAVSGESAAG